MHLGHLMKQNKSPWWFAVIMMTNAVVSTDAFPKGIPSEASGKGFPKGIPSDPMNSIRLLYWCKVPPRIKGHQRAASARHGASCLTKCAREIAKGIAKVQKEEL